MAREFGIYIKQLRMQRGLAVRQVATRSHVSARAISYWESGKTEPHAAELQAHFQTLDATLEQKQAALFLLDTLKGVGVARDLLPSYAPERLQDMPDIGHLLYALRQRRNLRAEQVAEALGINFTTLYRWERSQTLPSEESLARLCALLGASEEERQTALDWRERLPGRDWREVPLSVWEERVEAFCKAPHPDALYKRADNLFDLRGIALAAALWHLAMQNETAERLLERVYASQGARLMRRGRVGEAWKYSSLSLAIAERYPQQEQLCLLPALNAAYVSLCQGKDASRARESGGDLLKAWARRNLRPDVATGVFSWLVTHEARWGKKEATSHYAQQAALAAQQMAPALPHYEEMFHVQRLAQGVALAHAGDLDAAFASLPLPPTHHPYDEAVFSLYGADLALLAGARSDAENSLQRALSCIEPYQFPLLERRAQELKARLERSDS